MKVAVYGQYFKIEDTEYVENLFETLNKYDIDFVIEHNYYKSLKKHIELENNNTFSLHNELNDSFDFMFTVGGDGTILRAVTFIRESNIPIVGINTGRLGFLATIPKENISNAVELLLKKQYVLKERTLLSVSTTPKIESLASLNFALNEVSVSRKNTASMITIKTFLDNEFLNSYWADGLIIATPTGSTGYSLSCGGPVITPETKSFVITPIAPHNLSARPLIIPDATEIQLKVSGREESHLVSLDSRIATLENGTIIKIKKAPFTIKMVDLLNESFLTTLRKKLLWGEDKRN